MTKSELNSEQKSFAGQVMRTNFLLSLTQPMIEMLCAVADDVQWDRSRSYNREYPNNWFATEHALAKRGLIRRKPRVVLTEQTHTASAEFVNEHPGAYWRSVCELTDIGLAVVQVFKAAGIFVKADAAFAKETRGNA